MLESKPHGAERDRLELELQIALGVPTRAARGHGSADLEVIYGRARDLCEKLVDTPHLFTALYGLWYSTYARKPLPQARDMRSNWWRWRMRRATIRVAHWRGGRRVARSTTSANSNPRGRAFARASSCGDVEKARVEIQVYAEDPSVFCRCYGSWVLWNLGHVEKSRTLIGEALADAERLCSPYNDALAFTLASCLYVLRREFTLAVECANASSAICAEHGFPHWAATAMIHRGRAFVSLSRVEEGSRRIGAGLDCEAKDRDQTRHHVGAHTYGRSLWASGKG